MDFYLNFSKLVTIKLCSFQLVSFHVDDAQVIIRKDICGRCVLEAAAIWLLWSLVELVTL